MHPFHPAHLAVSPCSHRQADGGPRFKGSCVCRRTSSWSPLRGAGSRIRIPFTGYHRGRSVYHCHVCPTISDAGMMAPVVLVALI